MRRRLATWLLVVSTLVLLVTPVVVWATWPRPDVGVLPGMADAGSIGPAVPEEPPNVAGASSTARHALTVEVRSARLEDYEPPPRGPRPIGLTIEAIGVRAPIVPVGVEVGSRNVEVPSDVDAVGWYRFGPSPGADGSAVLLGHVDARTQGPGVFFRLRELEPADVVLVTFGNGSEFSFRVVARRSYAKSGLPPMLFEREGRPILALVTCGGSFDQASRSYSDNVVVFAVPRD
ncbi:MAG: class F sortase [Actinomycetota bacterium]